MLSSAPKCSRTLRIRPPWTGLRRCGLALPLLLSAAIGTSPSANPLSIFSGPSIAMAACGTNHQSLFTGAAVNVTAGSSIYSTLYTDNPSVCNNTYGNSYWPMIVDNNPINCGDPYAQDGYIVGQSNIYGPWVFDEVNNRYSCDPGPFFLGTNISAGSYYTYEVQLTHNSSVNFYKNGSLIDTETTDWNYGAQFQLFAETHDPSDIITNSWIDFSGIYVCYGTSQCTPSQTLTVPSTGNITNSNGMYKKLSSNYFVVCDKRTNTGEC